MRLSANFSLIEDVNDAAYFRDGGSVGMIRVLRDMGVTVLDFSFNSYAAEKHSAENSIFLKEGWRDWIRAMKSVAEEEGVSFSQCHALHNQFTDPEKPRLFRERMRALEDRVFEACNLLGIKRAVYHPATPESLRAGRDIAALKEFNVDWLTVTAEKAAAYDIRIAVENMNDYSHRSGGLWSYCGNPNELAELVDALGQPNVGVCLDTGHANISTDSVEGAVRVLGTRIESLHVADNLGIKDLHLPPFYGNINWDGVIQALAEVGYKGDLNYENRVRNLPYELQQAAVRSNILNGFWLVRRFHEAASRLSKA